MEGTEYGVVTKMMGGGRVETRCFADGVVRNCSICGRMRKKIWISVGDVVLISLRDFQDSKADVVHKYTVDDCRRLKAMGEIETINPLNTDHGLEEVIGDNDDELDFDEI